MIRPYLVPVSTDCKGACLIGTTHCSPKKQRAFNASKYQDAFDEP